MRAPPCVLCGRKRCRAPQGATCLALTRKRLTALQLVKAAKLPAIERCQEVELQIGEFNRALLQTRERSRLLDADISQRYILFQALQNKLASVIGNEAAEAYVRNLTGTFIRTLGPLEPIVEAMRVNLVAAARAHAEPTLELPAAPPPKLIEYPKETK